jgi:hypothetical protein
LRGARAPNLSLRSALRFSQPLGGLLRRRICGLVSSRCHVQGLSFVPSRGFSRSAAVPSSSLGPAPLPLIRMNSPATRLPLMRSRLRGFLLRSDAFVRVGGWPSPPSLPSAAFSSCGPSLHHRIPGSPGIPLLTFTDAVFFRALSDTWTWLPGPSSASCRWPRWRLPSP